MRKESPLLGLLLLSAILPNAAFTQDHPAESRQRSNATLSTEILDKGIHKLVTPQKSCGLEPCASPFKMSKSLKLPSFLKRSMLLYKEIKKLYEKERFFVNQPKDPVSELFNNLNSMAFYIQPLKGEQTGATSEIQPIIQAIKVTLEKMAAEINSIHSKSINEIENLKPPEHALSLATILHEEMKTLMSKINQDSDLKAYFSNPSNPGSSHYQNLKLIYAGNFSIPLIQSYLEGQKPKKNQSASGAASPSLDPLSAQKRESLLKLLSNEVLTDTVRKLIQTASTDESKNIELAESDSINSAKKLDELLKAGAQAKTHPDFNKYERAKRDLELAKTKITNAKERLNEREEELDLIEKLSNENNATISGTATLNTDTTEPNTPNVNTPPSKSHLDSDSYSDSEVDFNSIRPRERH